MPEIETSLSLLKRAQQGNADAWATIVEIYGPVILERCLKTRLGPEDAEDVLQEVLRSVYRGLPEFERELPQNRFLFWLLKITANKINDHFRMKVRQPVAAGGTSANIFLNNASAVPEDWDLSEVRADVYRQAVAVIRTEFEETTQQAFWLREVEQLSAAEAAERLGMSAGAVRIGHYRVKKRLKDALHGMLELDKTAES